MNTPWGSWFTRHDNWAVPELTVHPHPMGTAEQILERSGYSPEEGMAPRPQNQHPDPPEMQDPDPDAYDPEPWEWVATIQHRQKRILWHRAFGREWYYQYYNYWWDPQDWVSREVWLDVNATRVLHRNVWTGERYSIDRLHTRPPQLMLSLCCYS
jgi:hypothetical protein